MADIKILDFAKSVEQSRQSLIGHCKDNGKEADSSLSLSQIVDINNSINQEQQGFEGRWIDIDGTLLKVEYAQDGGSFTPPPTPSYDSEYLEFVEWVSPRDYTNVHSDIDIGANYRSKLDENGRRNTYLFCALDSTTGLDITIKTSTEKSLSTTYIDWGDGNTNEYTGSTSITATHSYSSEGQYVIKIWCDGLYYIRSSILGSKNATNGLIKLYIGENYWRMGDGTLNGTNFLQTLNIPNDVYNTTFPGYFSSGCYNLKAFILPKCFITQTYSSSGTVGMCHQCYTLKYVVLPSTITQLNTNFCSNCYAVEKVVMPESLPIFYSESCFSSCQNLKKVVLPNDISIIDEGMFYNCYNLQNIILPSSVTTINASAFAVNGLKSIIIPNVNTSIPKIVFNSCANLKNVVLPVGYNANANLSTFYPSFSKECLINIANSINDNSGTTTIHTLNFTNYLKVLFQYTYLDSQGNEVSNGTGGAVSLLEFMTNKNWTITFS